MWRCRAPAAAAACGCGRPAHSVLAAAARTAAGSAGHTTPARRRDGATTGTQGLAAHRLSVCLCWCNCACVLTVCLSACTHTSMPRLAATAAADVAPSNVLSSTSAQYTHSVVRDLHAASRALVWGSLLGYACHQRWRQRQRQHNLPVDWCDELPWEWRWLGCCMCLGKAPQPHGEAVEADLLKMCTAGAQGGDQQLVQVL